MTTTAVPDLLLALQLKLPTHTYKAVERFTGELGDEGRTSYLLGCLAERERSEGVSTQPAVREAA